MNTRRRELAEQVLAGYPRGPAAATEPTAQALARAADARAVILVEGLSDQIALETLASRRARDLAAEGVVIVPMGGARAAGALLARFGPTGAALTLAGLCDAGEEAVVRRALAQAGLGSPRDRRDMARLGFHVCVEDLEDELLRAVGPPQVEAAFDAYGDLGAFRSLQRQPPWQGKPLSAQQRRFLGSGASRKLRYARILVEALDLDRVPPPLDAVLASV